MASIGERLEVETGGVSERSKKKDNVGMNSLNKTVIGLNASLLAIALSLSLASCSSSGSSPTYTPQDACDVLKGANDNNREEKYAEAAAIFRALSVDNPKFGEYAEGLNLDSSGGNPPYKQWKAAQNFCGF